jgi:hypothetical protein
MQLKVKVGTNTERTTVIIDSAVATPKSVLAQQNIDIGNCDISLDGESLNAQKMNMTFDALGVTSDCYLVAVVRTKNAA